MRTNFRGSVPKASNKNRISEEQCKMPYDSNDWRKQFKFLVECSFKECP